MPPVAGVGARAAIIRIGIKPSLQARQTSDRTKWRFSTVENSKSSTGTSTRGGFAIPKPESQPLKPIDRFDELLSAQPDFLEDFPNERSSQITARMIRHRCCPTIWMPIKDMAALLPDRGEPHLPQE